MKKAIACLLALPLALAACGAQTTQPAPTTAPEMTTEATTENGKSTPAEVNQPGLTGRMRPVTGELRVGGVDARRHPGQVRTLTSIARIVGLIEPESSLTLEDCLTERTLFDGAHPRSRTALYLHAARLLGLEAPLTTLFGALPPLDQTRAALALACVRPATVVALDDLDDDTTLEDQRALWAGIAALTADGQPVIASTTERTVIPDDAIIIDLEPEA